MIWPACCLHFLKDFLVTKNNTLPTLQHMQRGFVCRDTLGGHKLRFRPSIWRCFFLGEGGIPLQAMLKNTSKSSYFHQINDTCLLECSGSVLHVLLSLRLDLTALSRCLQLFPLSLTQSIHIPTYIYTDLHSPLKPIEHDFM